MINSFPMSSETRVANGITLIDPPRMESGSAPDFSLSSRMMSVIAAARNPIRFPKTPMDRQPIFTSFGGAPPPTPRDRSHVTVSGERWSSSPISLSLRPFSFNSMALFTRASMLFIRSPGARIGLPLLRLLTPCAHGVLFRLLHPVFDEPLSAHRNVVPNWVQHQRRGRLFSHGDRFFVVPNWVQ